MEFTAKATDSGQGGRLLHEFDVEQVAAARLGNRIGRILDYSMCRRRERASRMSSSFWTSKFVGSSRTKCGEAADGASKTTAPRATRAKLFT